MLTIDTCRATSAGEHDSKGADRIDATALGDALFQLADHWTVGISAHEYAFYLRATTAHARYHAHTHTQSAQHTCHCM